MSKVDMFLALEGSRQGAFKGESQAEGHVSEIEIQAWSWGMFQQAHSESQAASKAGVRTLNIQKSLDSSSTAIMSALKTAEILSKVVLTCRDPGGVSTINYLRITLRKARICEYEIAAMNAEGRQVNESLSIAFKEIEVVYTPRSSANMKAGVCTYVDLYE